MTDSQDCNFDFESWQRQRSSVEEPLIRRICSALDINEDISRLSLSPAFELPEFFSDVKLFNLDGAHFERPCLPTGSYMYCAFLRKDGGDSIVELTPRNTALSSILKDHWELLPDLDPVSLAEFILTIQTVETTTHEVLADIAELDDAPRFEAGFVLSDPARRAMAEFPASTTMESSKDVLTIHALTLFGWMYKKQNLGVTNIRISRHGNLQFGDRRTICEPVYSAMPKIWY